MIQFKRIAVQIEGFKYPTVYVRELSVKQMRDLSKQKFTNDIDMFLFSLSKCLVNEQNDPIITENYTVDDLAEDLPQSYINKLATAFAELNADDDDFAVDTAKNS